MNTHRAEIEAALGAGKITPATVEYHKASCRQDGGLERFRDFVKAALLYVVLFMTIVLAIALIISSSNILRKKPKDLLIDTK